jgi:ribA/ribD-fused uncharacterized protein
LALSIADFRGSYRFLSNFEGPEIGYEGLTYKTVEAAFQAAKTTNLDEKLYIQGLPTPGQAKRAGRKVTLRPEWESIKLSVMEALLRQKFAQSPWGEWLLATGDEELIEGNAWGDTFWGICEGVGTNHLGILLMKIRSELRGNG